LLLHVPQTEHSTHKPPPAELVEPHLQFQQLQQHQRQAATRFQAEVERKQQVHPELLHGERCVLRSTKYFKFSEMLDLRDKGGGGGCRTDGRGKTNVAPNPRNRASRRTVNRTMKRMLAGCYQLLMNLKRQATGEGRGERKIHVLDPVFGLGMVGVCVGVKVEVAVTVIGVGVAVTMSVKVVDGLLLKSRSSLCLTRSMPPSIS
jgi:hypothetical protein